MSNEFRATCKCSDAVLQLRCAGRACTVNAAEDLSVCFDTVTDDSAIAVRANRRQRVDCAFEAIEGVTLSTHNDFKTPLSYSFSQTSHVGIHNCFAREELRGGV